MTIFPCDIESLCRAFSWVATGMEKLAFWKRRDGHHNFFWPFLLSIFLMIGNLQITAWVKVICIADWELKSVTNVTTHPMETQKRNMNFSRSHYHIFKDLCGKLQFQSWSVVVSLISSMLKWALMMNQVSECFSVMNS